MRGEQAADQVDAPGQAGLRRKMVEVNGDRIGGSRRYDRRDIVHQAVVGNALIIEGRQQQRARKAEVAGVARERDRIRNGCGTCPDHQAVERQAGFPIGRHHPLALLERERRGLARGAEHVEPIASIVEKKARKHRRARAIRFAGLVDGRCDRGDDALKSLCQRWLSWLYPLTSNAASAAMLTIWRSFADNCTICTGRSSPTRMGPMTVAPPSSCRSCVEIDAEWKAGMTSTLAGPLSRQNG